MSEYSESYHLRDATQANAVELLNHAGLKGIVFPTAGSWTSFVPVGRDWEGLSAIVQANRGWLLHYAYGEDHGWVIEVYQGSESRMHFESWWDDEDFEELGDLVPPRPPNNLNFELLAEWVQAGEECMDELRECLEVDGRERAYQFAELIGLRHYQWLSPSQDLESLRKPGTVEV